MRSSVTPRLRSHRLALVAAALIVGLGACGSDESANESAEVTAADAPGEASTSATTLPVDGPPVIRVAEQGATEAASAGAPADAPAAGALVEDDSAASTKMMASGFQFVFDGLADALIEPAASWYFPPVGLPRDDAVAALAAQFGIEGPVEPVDEERGGGLIVGPDDYTAPSLSVGTDAMQSWWYTPGDQITAQPLCEPVKAADGSETEVADDSETEVADGSETEAVECEPLPPPVNVLTKEQAEEKTTVLFERLGFDAQQFEYETYADEWSASVNAFLVLEGVRTNVSMYVSYGDAGAITYAGGFLATAQRGDDYPRIGAAAAVERLNSPNWMGGFIDTSVLRTDEVVTGEGVAEGEVATGEVAVGEGTKGSSGAAGDPSVVGTADTLIATVPPDDRPLVDQPVCDPAADCVPPVDAEPIVVHLSNPRPSLEQLWAEDATVWLVPGYAFDSDDQGQYTVIAIDSAYLAVDEPQPASEPGVETVPVTGAPTATVVADTGTAVPPSPTTLLFPNPQDYTGLALEEATKVVEQHGWVMRVVREDGVDLAATDDFVEHRLNVAVEGGIVTELISVG